MFLRQHPDYHYAQGPARADCGQRRPILQASIRRVAANQRFAALVLEIAMLDGYGAVEGMAITLYASVFGQGLYLLARLLRELLLSGLLGDFGQLPPLARVLRHSLRSLPLVFDCPRPVHCGGVR